MIPQQFRNLRTILSSGLNGLFHQIIFPSREKLNLRYTIYYHCLKEGKHLQTLCKYWVRKGHVTTTQYYCIQNTKREFLNTNTVEVLCVVLIIAKKERERSCFHLLIFTYHKLSFNSLLIHTLLLKLFQIFSKLDHILSCFLKVIKIIR